MGMRAYTHTHARTHARTHTHTHTLQTGLKDRDANAGCYSLVVAGRECAATDLSSGPTPERIRSNRPEALQNHTGQSMEQSPGEDEKQACRLYQ